jgi:hypothetical protein
MRRLGTLCLAALTFTGAVAQDFRLSPDPETIQAVKFTMAPRIDGTIDPQEWAGIGMLSRSLIIGGTNQDSGEKGQVWIGYDDTYIYIAARIFLQNPRKISADEFRDNVDLDGNDAFVIQLDTFGLHHESNQIGFNANGATFLEIAGGRAAKLEWSGRVEAAARTTETGWEGEVRIPWALLPLPPSGVRDMKFDFDWYVSATDRGVTTHTNAGDPTKVHTLAGVLVPQVSVKRSLLLLPYMYGGYNDETREHIANAGLDFKSAVTSEVNMVGTVNPDFRNIEGDILDLDFSNFERLGNETRPFFQEGSDYYFFGMGRRIFASQRIREFDTGLSFYGNIGGTNRIGLISTFDFGNQSTVAGAYTHNPDPYWEFTTAFSSLHRPGEDNLSGRMNISRELGNWDAFIDGAFTDDEIIGKGSAVGLGMFYNVPGWGGRIFYDDVTADFFPRIGFAAETDYRGISVGADRELEFTSGALRSMEAGIDFFDYKRRNGEHYREGGGFGMEFSLANQLALGVGLEYEHFMDRHDRAASFGFEYPQNSAYRQFGAEIVVGHIDNDPYRSVEVGVLYRPVKRFQLSLSAQAVQHTEDEEQIVFNFNYLMNKYESIGGRIVYNEREWNWYASYRMGGNLGAEYFLIIGDPNASTFQKTLVFKVTMPFAIRW